MIYVYKIKIHLVQDIILLVAKIDLINNNVDIKQ